MFFLLLALIGSAFASFDPSLAQGHKKFRSGYLPHHYPVYATFTWDAAAGNLTLRETNTFPVISVYFRETPGGAWYEDRVSKYAPGHKAVVGKEELTTPGDGTFTLHRPSSGKTTTYVSY